MHIYIYNTVATAEAAERARQLQEEAQSGVHSSQARAPSKLQLFSDYPRVTVAIQEGAAPSVPAVDP